jgi:hypothetical protein
MNSMNLYKEKGEIRRKLPLRIPHESQDCAAQMKLCIAQVYRGGLGTNQTKITHHPPLQHAPLANVCSPSVPPVWVLARFRGAGRRV